jgi:N-acylneuraminate cytidylyltransferase
LPFCGKPIIAWSIEAALASGCFDQVLVSTDDKEIADVALKHGATVPFVRPQSLANDFSGTGPVIAHAIEFLQSAGHACEQVCCIYATAPFVRAEDLQQGLQLLLEDGCEFAFSVTSYAFPIQRAVRINAAGGVEMFQPECFAMRSQDLEHAYHDAGQFYWGTRKAWLEGKSIFAPYARPVILPRYRVQDIDTLEDWEQAEWIFRAMYRVDF